MQPSFPASGLDTTIPSNHDPRFCLHPNGHREWSVTTPDDNSLLHSSISFSTAILARPAIESVKLVALRHSGRRIGRGKGKDQVGLQGLTRTERKLSSVECRGSLYSPRRDWASRRSWTSASYLGDVAHPDASCSPTHTHHSEIQRFLSLTTTSPHLVARHGSRGAPSEDLVRCVCFCRNCSPKSLLREPPASPFGDTSLTTRCALVSMFS